MNTAKRSLSSFSTGNKTFVFLFSFVFVLNSFASAQSNFTLSGTITDSKQNEISLLIDNYFLNYKPETVKAPVKDGHVELTTHLDRGNVIPVRGDLPVALLYAEPGDDLRFSCKDGDKTGSISFSGKGAEHNTFLKQFYDQFKNDFDDSVMQPKMLSTGLDAFEISVFNNRKKQNDFFKNAPDKNKFSPGFTQFMQNTIAYRYWNLLLSYPIINANNNQGLTVNPLPGVMLEDFTKVQLNNDAALLSEPYREFLKYYVIYNTSQANGFNKFTDYSLSADKKLTLAKDRLKGDAYRFWLAKFSVDECSRLSPYMTKKLFSALKEVDKEGKYTAIVNEVCGAKMAMKEEKKKEDVKGNDNSTQSSGTFILHGGSMDESLDLVDEKGKHVLLSSFKGKVVYIDFWASWCGPCRKMMPYSKSLHENLTDKQKKQIVFLYISIDADSASWKKGIQDLGIQGINANSPGNWTAKVCKYFQIYSIPRYMIMDKKGDIVDFNAKRPADPAILDDLLKSLGD